MRRSGPVAAALALAAACSSGSGTSTLSSPSPVLSPSSSPTMPAATPPASPSATQRAAPSASPIARRTASPTPSPTRSRTPSPKPSPTKSPAPAGKTYAISQVTGDMFSPKSVALKVGDSVLVTDKDAIAPHTFTISALGVDSGGMGQGDTFRYRFARAGTFTFMCTYHNSAGMNGTITVGA
jgi:plastocyanin